METDIKLHDLVGNIICFLAGFVYEIRFFAFFSISCKQNYDTFTTVATTDCTLLMVLPSMSEMTE